MQNNSTITIALIDDDESMRTMMLDFIRGKYPEAIIHTYTTGEEALDKIMNSHHAVILDYNLDSAGNGKLNGIATYRQLKDRFPATPVIFISGQESSDVAASTILHGAKDYIIKNENLFKRLDKVLDTVIGKTRTANGVNEKSNILLILLIIIIAIVAGIYLWNK